MKFRTEDFKKDACKVAASHSRTAVLLMGLKVVMYSALMAVIVLIILLDARQPDGIRFTEYSYTQYAQETFLLLSSMIFYLSVRYFPKQALVGILFGGFFGMAYIREFDAFLDDNVADGAWQVLVYSLATLTAFLAYRERRSFWQQLETITNSRAFGFLISGMLTVFIFSRLYGDHLIWQTTMEDAYMYIVTRASEESIELLGYSLIFIGALEYILHLKGSMKRKSNKSEEKNDFEELRSYNKRSHQLS